MEENESTQIKRALKTYNTEYDIGSSNVEVFDFMIMKNCFPILKLSIG